MLDEAVRLAGRWLEGVRDGPIPPTSDVEQVKDALGRDLPDRGPDPVTVLQNLARAAEPGLMRIHSPRFHAVTDAVIRFAELTIETGPEGDRPRSAASAAEALGHGGRGA